METGSVNGAASVSFVCCGGATGVRCAGFGLTDCCCEEVLLLLV